jgi:uncharacterized membrane protein YeaQ/YmgE (transglycosylase-associated protein family)
MEPQSLIVFLLVGLVAGWLAGKLVRGGGFGLIGDIIVGVIGAFIGAGCCRRWVSLRSSINPSSTPSFSPPSAR